MAKGRKSSAAASGAASEENASECCAKCESDIAALRKEIADLKKELAKKPAGGADARLEKLIAYFKQNPNVKRKLEEAGV